MNQPNMQNGISTDPGREDAKQRALYPQSVASGEPRPDGIVLWTRIDPTQQESGQGAPVRWQIASDAAFTAASLVVEGASAIDAARDNTVKVAVRDTRLQPYSSYWYRFVYNGIASRTGRFKTLPGAGARLDSLKLAYIVCQDYGSGYYTALAHLLAEDVDYVLHLGDYIYESIASPDFQTNPVRVVPPFPSGNLSIPRDLDDYRHLYKVYRSDPDQQAVHERFAYIQLWDDHEFGNDCHQDFHPDHNTAPDTADTPHPALRQAANQAWAEYGLADVPFDPTKDWEHSIRVYRTLSLGALADIVITDQRLYRDGPPCGSKEFGERYFTTGCAERLDPARSMLGVAQREWFLDQMKSSRATWKLWANEVMLMQLKIPDLFLDLDQWDGYPAERAAILGHLGAAGVRNLVALTGDIHTFAAGYLKPDYDTADAPSVGIELVVGSLTSANFKEEIESEAHLPSSPLPASQFGVRHDLLEPLIRGVNRHIEYWDSATHGYGILTLTPDELSCEFKGVSTIREKTAKLVSLQTLTVPAGEVRLKVKHGGILGAIEDGLAKIL
jgi:alkaline phosphatase D